MRPADLLWWWRDGPVRYTRWRWWKVLLFAKGEGWLRWRLDHRTKYHYGFDPPEDYTVAPPLRRLWDGVSWTVRGSLLPDEETRRRSFYNGFRDLWYERDPDRKSDLAWVPPSRKQMREVEARYGR